jgi:hypothetical protein
MKRLLNISAIAILFLFVAAACNQQGQRADFDSVRDDFRDALAQIDEALRTQDHDDFRDRADDAINKVDNAVDDFLDEMDSQDRRMDQQTRNQVINIKQKRSEVEFKLSLLEHDRDGNGWGTTNDRDRRDTRVGTDGRTDGTVHRDATTDDRMVQDQRTATDYGTADRRVDTRGTDDRRVDTRDTDTRWDTDNGDDRLYGRNLQEEIRNDLRELRDEVQQFMQANLDYQDELD